MSFLNGNKFADRQAAAAEARKKMAEKFLANSKYDPTDPAIFVKNKAGLDEATKFLFPDVIFGNLLGDS